MSFKVKQQSSKLHLVFNLKAGSLSVLRALGYTEHTALVSSSALYNQQLCIAMHKKLKLDSYVCLCMQYVLEFGLII